MKGHERDPRWSRRRRDTCILWSLGLGALRDRRLPVAAPGPVHVQGAGRRRIARAGDAAARREPARLGGGPGPPLPGPVHG